MKRRHTVTRHPCLATGEWRELAVYGVAPETPGLLPAALSASHSDDGTVFFDNLKMESAQKEPNQ